MCFFGGGVCVASLSCGEVMAEEKLLLACVFFFFFLSFTCIHKVAS